MNKERKESLRRTISKINLVVDSLKEQSYAMQEIIFKEQDVIDSMPDNFKMTDRWADAEALLDEMYRLKDNVDYCVSTLLSSVENVETAM